MDIQYGTRTIDILDIEDAWSLGWEMFFLGQPNPFNKLEDAHSEWNEGRDEAQQEFGKSAYASRTLPQSCPACGGDLQKPDGNCCTRSCFW